MYGDFTRWTFDPQQAYRAVLLQQGRVLLDADWNEQTAITAHHDETRTLDVVGPDGGPAEGAGFAVLTATGSTPDGSAFKDLRIGPGRYYAAGTLVESPPPPPGETAGWPFDDQPHVRKFDGTLTVDEPPETGRHAVLLDVWTHHVTADERATLLESALGGPDTSTRAQTVWQVRLEFLEEGQVPDTSTVTHGTMAAMLQRADTPDPDPCRLTAATGGYRRLENQLYRVEIRNTGVGAPTFVWSRENGSVVAGLTAITAAVDGQSAELTLDREGPDDELSIRPGDTIEVTGTDLQLRSQAGFLATVVAVRATRVTVRWTGPAPASLTALGGTRLVRRWDGPERPLDTRPQDLEDGIQVRFPDDGGQRSTGDHWLVPARTMRLLYGQTGTTGSIDWPPGADGTGEARPPLGPVRHTVALAILDKGDTGWTLEADCRRLFPALIHLTTLDPAGGDGQEAWPGTALPQPVRVRARNGGLPLVGARVRFRTQGAGRLDGGGGSSGSTVTVQAGADGIAQVTWILDAQGAPSQTVTAELLDHDGVPPVVLAGRLSRADGIAFGTPATCAVFGATETVQSALEKVSARRELRLLGGDGQHLRVTDKVLPQAVRVVVDSICGPVAGASVVATPGQGGLVLKATGVQPPADLATAGGQSALPLATGADGSAAVWWQPASGAVSDTLQLALQGVTGTASLTVTAQALPRERAVAADIGFTPPATCTVFGASETVQTALVKVVQREELRLLGGDGQRLQVPQKVLPQPVRVLVDSICGPVAGVSVVASASSGAMVARVTGLQPPPDLASAGGQQTLPTTTGSTGQAAFWWQPAPGVANDSLQVVLQGATGATPVIVTTRAPGRSWIHLTRVMVSQVGALPDFLLQNDSPLTSQQLLSGIHADTDQPLDSRTVVGKPVCYVELDLPWPVPGESTPLSTSTFVAFRTVRLPSTDTTSTPPVTSLRWAPSTSARTWLGTLISGQLGTTAISGPLAGRFVIEGWGVIGTDPSLHLNCHVPVAIENGVPHFQVVDPAAAKPVFVVDDEVVRDRFVLRFNLQG
ncbi:MULTISPECIES: DUF6519 domain-containing protein [unclassified Streptomyces]|uniref:DUF6519 domain-containing protein n=1 Tax=unclassified Streptomyces TaxID=2593676 RepID=UPI00324D598B